jgi:thioredoxin reductase (NADPH)
MLDRAKEQDNITLKPPFEPVEVIAGDDGKVSSLRIRNTETGEEETLDVGGVFIAIGHTPRSELVEGQVETDDGGYVLTQPDSTRTALAGVFAIGDLVDHTYRQAITAAGTGCMGALDAEWFLRDTPPSPEAHWQRGGEPVEVAPTPS